MLKSLILLFFFSISIFSQKVDTIKTYKIKEITVQSSLVLQPQSLIKIDAKEIEMSDAQTLKDIAVILPSVKMQANSRGEAYFHLRNSGNRQLLLLFDGVPVNLPWDGRFDLSLLPTNAIGSISISKGIPSVIYGANALGGVINVSSLQLRGKTHAEFRTLFGENNFKDISFTIASGNSSYSYVFSGKYYGSNGFLLPSDFSSEENPGRTRLNSFSNGVNFFGKVSKFYGNNSNIGVSLLYFSGEKGVAPEIGTKKKRFWKYPKINRLTATVNGTHYFKGNNRFVTYAFNYGEFNSTINQFTDATYSELDKKEEGKDKTYFGRVIFTNIFSETSLINLSASGFSSKHYENISEVNAGALTPFPENIYEQRIVSIGGEYQFIQTNWNFTLGASYDGAFTPLTGSNPKKSPVNTYGLNASFVYGFAPNFITRINFGRKTRFPSMREMYSEALGKFKINPDLKEETGTEGEIGITYSYGNLDVDADLFANYIKDGIVRMRLPAGEPHKFMRVNKSEIRILGLEAEFKYELTENFDAGINVALFDSKSKNSKGEFTDTLEYKPGIIAGLFINYKLNDFLVAAEGKYVGQEYGLEDYYELLPSYFIFNLRLSYFLRFMNLYKSEIILRANNIFDELYFTQIGLPGAGREIKFGFNIYFEK